MVGGIGRPPENMITIAELQAGVNEPIPDRKSQVDGASGPEGPSEPVVVQAADLGAHFSVEINPPQEIGPRAGKKTDERKASGQVEVGAAAILALKIHTLKAQPGG